MVWIAQRRVYNVAAHMNADEKMMAGVQYMHHESRVITRAFEKAEFGIELHDKDERFYVALGLKKAAAFENQRSIWIREAKVAALEHAMMMWKLDNTYSGAFDCRAVFGAPPAPSAQPTPPVAAPPITPAPVAPSAKADGGGPLRRFFRAFTAKG